MPNSLPTSGPYTTQDLLNAVLTGSGSAWQLQMVLTTGTASLGTLTVGTGTMTIAGSGGVVTAAPPSADGLAQTGTALYVIGAAHLYNGSSFDRERGNYDEAVLASAARVGTTTSTAMVNYNARGLAVFCDITAGTTLGTLGTFNIQALVSSGTYMTIAAFAPTNYTTGVAGFLLYPGAASAGGWNVAPVQGVLPRNWRLQILPLTATSTMTYYVNCSYIL